MSYSTSLDDLLGPPEGSQGPPPTQQPPMMNQQHHAAPSTNNMDNNQFVDAILTELDSMPSYGNDINSAAQKYATDHNAHVPPPILGDTAGLLKAEDSHSPDLMSGEMFKVGSSNSSWLKRNKYNLIYIAVFFTLMFVLSLHQVNRVIFGFMPKLILENGQISILGIALKTVIATIIFGLVVFLA